MAENHEVKTMVWPKGIAKFYFKGREYQGTYKPRQDGNGFEFEYPDEMFDDFFKEPFDGTIDFFILNLDISFN